MAIQPERKGSKKGKSIVSLMRDAMTVAYFLEKVSKANKNKPKKKTYKEKKQEKKMMKKLARKQKFDAFVKFMHEHPKVMKYSAIAFGCYMVAVGAVLILFDEIGASLASIVGGVTFAILKVKKANKLIKGE